MNINSLFSTSFIFLYFYIINLGMIQRDDVINCTELWKEKWENILFWQWTVGRYYVFQCYLMVNIQRKEVGLIHIPRMENHHCYEGN